MGVEFGGGRAMTPARSLLVMDIRGQKGVFAQEGEKGGWRLARS